MGFLSDVAGSLIGGASSFFGGERQNDAAASSAREAAAINRENFKNRHQWEVADLKKAGLNPILSAHGSPPGASAPAAAVPSNSIGEGVNSAMAARRLRAEIDLMAQQRKESMAREALTDTQNLKTFEEKKGISYDNRVKDVLSKADSRWHGSSAGQFFRLLRSGGNPSGRGR